MALSNLTKQLDKGRLPPIKLEVTPIDTEGRFKKGAPYVIERFTSYSFSNNILIPVDTFGFAFRPDPPKQGDKTTYYSNLVKEGDIVELTVSGKQIATGYVDAIDTITDVDTGVILQLQGRDFMGYLEDNDAVNPDSSIIWNNRAKIKDVLSVLLKSTRIQGTEFRHIAENVTQHFATNPGESKLAALQRFLEPLNAIAWMTNGGKLVCGKPSFDGASQGTIGVRAFDRTSNVLTFRAHRASGQIPNAILSIWTGLESVQSTIAKKELKTNTAAGPSRLYKSGHKVYRTNVTSIPSGNDTKDGLQLLNRIIESANFMDAIAARDLARENINELIVTCTVVGHLNAKGDPFAADQCYHVVHDADGIDEKMYLFGVEYALSEDAGQVTHLSFCRLNTIVAGGPT